MDIWLTNCIRQRAELFEENGHLRIRIVELEPDPEPQDGNKEAFDLRTPYLLEDHQEALLWLEEHVYVKDSSNQWWQAEEEHAQADCAIAEFIAGTKEPKDGRRDVAGISAGSLRSPADSGSGVDGERRVGTLKPIPEPQQDTPGQRNGYDKLNPLHDLEGWIVFYGQQAQRLENDLGMREVFQASCETADLLLELKRLRNEPTPVQDTPGQAERVYVPHETRPVQVWADVDLGIADMVVYLNTIEGVRTQASCQGTIGEGGGAHPYGPQVLCTWAPEALARLQAEFNVDPEGDGLWGYVHPRAEGK